MVIVEWLGATQVTGPAVRAQRVPVAGDKDAYNRQGQDPRGRLMLASRTEAFSVAVAAAPIASAA